MASSSSINKAKGEWRVGMVQRERRWGRGEQSARGSWAMGEQAPEWRGGDYEQDAVDGWIIWGLGCAVGVAL